MKIVRLLLLPLLACSFLGMAKKQPLVSVRFYLEANARDGTSFSTPTKLHNPDRDAFMERIPSISERDIEGVFPVENADGTFGCVFQLDRHGSVGLQTLSSERRGSTLLGLIGSAAGARQLVELRIDKPITDGRIYVPRGKIGRAHV